jgi:hypothetical protein
MIMYEYSSETAGDKTLTMIGIYRNRNVDGEISEKSVNHIH